MGYKMSTSMAVARKLIHCVRKYPVLYDVADQNYRNNEMKEELWEKIAADLNEYSRDVKRRWRNLRDTYMKLLKLVKASENDTVFYAAAIQKYNKWVWTKEMEFFRSCFRYGNLKLDAVPDYRTLSPQPFDDDSVGSETMKKAEKRQASPNPSQPPPKKIKKEPSIENVNLNIKSTTSTTTSVRAKPEPEKVVRKQPGNNKLDATDRLLLAHAQTVKQFTARRQAITKLKIAEVLMEQEILHHEDVELASISATTAGIAPNKKKSQRQNMTEPFETVCAYVSEDVHERPTKSENKSRNPVEID